MTFPTKLTKAEQAVVDDLAVKQEAMKSWSERRLKEEYKLYEKEFDAIFTAKDKKGRYLTNDIMFERMFKPHKYPEHHHHLDVIHELWIRSMSPFIKALTDEKENEA